MQADYSERRDKGMIVLPPVSPTKHERLMAQVFPELPEAAAVEMYEGGACPWLPRLGPAVRPARERYADSPDYDHDYERFKAITRRNSF